MNLLAGPQAASVAWQALGSAATVGAALWVSWRMGLAAQGEFGLARSWFDAAAAVASLGLPQGLLHLQYRLRVEACDLLPWLRRGLASGLVLGMLCAAALVWLAPGWALAAAVALSLPFAVAHLLARSLLIHIRGVVVYGVVTALPSLLVLAGMLLWPTAVHAVLVTAAVLASVVSVVWVLRGARAAASDRDWSRAELWHVSRQSWVQAALGALLPAGVLSTLTLLSVSQADVGAASLGLLLYQSFAVAAGYVAPLIFDRLARDERPTLAGHAWPPALRFALVLLLATAAAGVMASPALPAAVVAWLLPLSLTVPAGIAALAARVSGTVLLARGAYRELSWQALWRLLGVLALAAALLRWVPAAAAVACALLVIELASWWRSQHVLARV